MSPVPKCDKMSKTLDRKRRHVFEEIVGEVGSGSKGLRDLRSSLVQKTKTKQLSKQEFLLNYLRGTEN